MILFKFKSTLLKIIPVFGAAGNMLIEDFLPVCNPMPLNLVIDETVF